MKAKRDYLVELSSGGAQPNISQGIIKDLKIPLPPLAIQQQIVDEIEGYQKVIDGAKQVIKAYNPHISVKEDWKMVELEGYIDFISGLTLSIPDCQDENGVPTKR